MPSSPGQDDLGVDSRADDNFAAVETSTGRTSRTILDRFSAWSDKIHPKLGRGVLNHRVEELLADKKSMVPYDGDEPSVFSGRMDVSRP